MKVRIEDDPDRGDGVNGGRYGIRLYPETVEEVAELERPLSLNIKVKEFQRIVSGGIISYYISFESYCRKVHR